MTSNSVTQRSLNFAFGPELLPGLVLSGLVAGLCYVTAPYIARVVPVPAIVLALIIGMVLNPVAVRPPMHRGISFCVKTVLRWSVALLGLRIGLGDIATLGTTTMAVVVLSMFLTLIAGFAFARLARQHPGFGAFIGVGTAVCGASATLAVSTVVPDYKAKQADVVFVVVALNALATIAMLIYPSLCLLIGFDDQATGIMLGATIHDVAQVAGAGYAISDEVGNTAVIVKLFRVFLLLPIVLCVGIYLNRSSTHSAARVPVPIFAIAFLGFSLVNSTMQFLPAAMPTYIPIRTILVELSSFGLLLAISALGLETSMKSIVNLGCRHIVSLVGTSLVILGVTVASLVFVG